ncbi:hypothetical protein NE237_020036 [Protea cynaroides]|uniref:Protein PLASTID MOVEMENT IMPAIRED 2 n=1 Tax=Protea cynaroides TaxID=273540 RepID=A0A9Q0H585_9MAGN|nr:hypothetical protein NE237_020036 [Protea cynaroides]
MKMDRAETADRMQMGSVKAAISLFGEGFKEEKPQPEKIQMEFFDVQKKPPSRAKELHLAKRDMGLLNENREVAESVKVHAESELYTARMRVKDISSRIEESNLKAKSQKCEFEKLQKRQRHYNGLAFTVGKAENHQYAQLMRELEFVKQELSKLKLERDSLLEEKLQAEKEFEASVSRLKSHSNTVETLSKEIEERNEEQVLVHLARIEAVKELGAIEAQRRIEVSLFSEKLGRTRNRIKDLTQELEYAKKLESKLAITTSDVNVLQNELELIKAMDQRVEESQTSKLLQSITEELETAKKELASIKEGGFQLMACMDIIREELKQVSEENDRRKTTEEKTDMLVQNLNSKLFRAKSKLEAAHTDKDKAKLIVSNLSETFQKLQADAKAAKEEREFFSEEAATIRTEIQKTERESDLAEDMLEDAMMELVAVKASEAMAFESLKAIAEKIMKARAQSSQYKSTITIPKFEYEYLISCAKGAKELADKKVAAAQAWTEALRASEKEILMNTEAAKREISELRLVEEPEEYKTEKSMKVKTEIEEEQQHEKPTNVQLEKALPRKSIKDNGSSTPTRRPRPLRSNSTGSRHLNRSTTFTIKKRRKVMPNLVKFFGSKKTKNHL